MTSPPRRTTRSALARFSYHETAVASASSLHPSNSLPDIEDGTASGPRKRRRVAREEHTVTTATTKTTTETSAQDAKPEGLTPTAPVPKSSTPRKQRKPARVVKGATPSSVTTVEPPTDWEHMYNLVREMRFGGPARDAPVDSMGCERLFAPGACERDKRFHILVALMLSSQTKDTVNAVAMGRLHTELPPHEPGAPAGLNLENVLAVEPVKLNELIRQVGFHNNKTKFIKQAALILRDQHASDIPATLDGLTSLPGVGPKMAHLCLSAAWDRTEGIGVDVHVHRITNLWGWHGKKPTSGPEATRLALEAWLPREKWHEINTLLVGLGQTVCPPQAGSRRCGECSLGLEGLCKAADRKKVAEGRRKEHVKVEKEEDDSLQTVIKLEEECEEDKLEVKQEETVTSLTGEQATLQEAIATTKDEADAGTDNQPRRAHVAEARRRSGRQCGTST